MIAHNLEAEPACSPRERRSLPVTMRRQGKQRHVEWVVWLGAALALGACTCEPPAVVADAGAGDGGVEAQHDAGLFDAGGADAGPADAGAEDAGADAGPSDGGEPDAGQVDAGATDAGPDAGADDAGAFDAGLDDAGTADAGADDAGQVVLTCTSCHGDVNPAPPRDVDGGTDRSLRTVGAHQVHLGPSGWHREVRCEDCHRVPAAVDAPGHLDAPPAELTFGGVANAGDVASSFDGATCTTYCHGVTLDGGTTTQPDWRFGSRISCYQCHGIPPPPPHPATAPFACSRCHPDVFANPQGHIDGRLDVTVDCKACHGDPSSPAPPADTQGRTSTALRTVGAHRAHLGPSRWHAQLDCADCHTVPTRLDDPGHIDPSPAELHFGSLAKARGASPAWDGATCSAYCHGQTIDGGTNHTPLWTKVDGTQAACGTCHSLPPAAPHPQNPRCEICHGAVVDGGLDFIDPELHINGQVDVSLACGSCHALPPATGSHLAHVGVQGTRAYGSLSTAASVTSPTGYAFGCGNCHPLDPSRHLSGGRADVELGNPLAPPGSLKARSPTATYTPGATTFLDDAGIGYTQGTCGNVYCHSGPALTSGPVPAPGFDFGFVGYPITYPPYSLTVARDFRSVRWGDPNPGCGGCHGAPIRTQAPATQAAVGQSHSWLAAAGLEVGHAFNHGGAPLPCKTCHTDTVSAAGTTSRSSGLAVYSPVPISGFARHVNGLPDVAFDAAPVQVAGRTVSLAGASYSQSTSSCANVACHKAQSSVKNGHPFRPDSVSSECNACHRY